MRKHFFRAVAFKNPKGCANAAVKLPLVRSHIVEGLGRLLHKEAKRYFQKNNFLKIYKSILSEISKLKIQDVEKELCEEMPIAVRLMESLSCVHARKLKEKKKKEKQDKTAQTSGSIGISQKGKIQLMR